MPIYWPGSIHCESQNYEKEIPCKPEGRRMIWSVSDIHTSWALGGEKGISQQLSNEGFEHRLYLFTILKRP